MSKRKTVLIVDDSTALLDALTAAFEDAGYDVGSAVDGEEVFRKMATLDPDALLLDIYMPKINGADVCRLVKAHPHWKKTFLVLMSARISDKEIEMYRRIGANDIMRKPFEASVAVEAVRKVIGPPEPAQP
jgi:twitching motility two-component system response regulator PilG